VTHAGWNSTKEAILAGTPTICFPLNFDQPTNAALIEAKGLGLKVEKYNYEANVFKDTIQKVLDNYEQYRKNVMTIQESFENSMELSYVIRQIVQELNK